MTPTQLQRLAKIVQAVDCLNVCVEHRFDYKPDWIDPMGATIGEMDWLEALHYLLYEEE
jgi:hypothetical protein